jgi:pimeloyl-ACP methyl ester carboxylesterase
LRHKVADIDGPVHYLDFGGSGPPLLMVHGLAGAAINWMAVGAPLANSHRALALDLAGFGEKVIGEPVVLMGNSMGAHIGVLEAAARPDAVDALVLVDAALPGTHVSRPQPLMLGAMAALSIPGLAERVIDRRVRALGAGKLVQEALALVCADPSRVPPEVVEAHVRLTRERGHLGPQSGRAFVQASRSIGLRMASPRFWSRVAAVKAPTLVIHGSRDRLIPVEAARELVRRRPDWELKVLEGVGHVPMMERPVLFLDALRSWSAYRIATAAAAS